MSFEQGKRMDACTNCVVHTISAEYLVWIRGFGIISNLSDWFSVSCHNERHAYSRVTGVCGNAPAYMY
jgi:hypothetical protein